MAQYNVGNNRMMYVQPAPGYAPPPPPPYGVVPVAVQPGPAYVAQQPVYAAPVPQQPYVQPGPSYAAPQAPPGVSPSYAQPHPSQVPVQAYPQQQAVPQAPPAMSPPPTAAPLPLPLANASVTGAASIPYPNQRQYDTSIPGGLPGPKDDYVAELGRASWKVLHACAEQFPPYPTPQEQQAMLMFVHSFAQVYPCIKCRIHFQQSLQQYPPDVSSQSAFVKWMSLFHDQVNASIGKPAWKQQPQQ
jgi:hypothetical protein